MAHTMKPPLFPRELLEQPSQARRAYFQAYTVAHPALADVDQKVANALREPGGALLIFVVGPTGVGKSTFLARLEQRLIEQALARMEEDPGHRPVVSIQAKVPASREFRWGIFYTQGLIALQEPLLNYKVNPRASLSLGAGERRRFVTPRMTGDADVLRLSWEQAVAHCRPVAILIDEAHHMGQAARNAKGVVRATYSTWLSKQDIPQLETLLSICALWKISLYECLFEDVADLALHSELGVSGPSKGKHQQNRRGSWGTSQVRDALEAILTNGEFPPPSLGAVARRLDCSPASLLQHHREVCNALTERYQAYVQTKKQTDLQQYCEEVRQAARHLASQGKRQTATNLARC